MEVTTSLIPCDCTSCRQRFNLQYTRVTLWPDLFKSQGLSDIPTSSGLIKEIKKEKNYNSSLLQTSWVGETALCPWIKPDQSWMASVELIKAPMIESASQRQRAANLFQHAVKRFRAADVKADEDGIWIRVGERPYVVVVWRPCRRRRETQASQIYFGSVWKSARQQKQKNPGHCWWLITPKWTTCGGDEAARLAKT